MCQFSQYLVSVMYWVTDIRNFTHDMCIPCVLPVNFLQRTAMMRVETSQLGWNTELHQKQSRTNYMKLNMLRVTHTHMLVLQTFEVHWNSSDYIHKLYILIISYDIMLTDSRRDPHSVLPPLGDGSDVLPRVAGQLRMVTH